MEDMMAGKKGVWELEELAAAQIGLRGSPLIFVTEEGVVRAVFTKRTDMNAAEAFADSLPEDHAVVIEDYGGVAWENDESKRRQREED
jgi:hypothetical protein